MKNYLLGIFTILIIGLFSFKSIDEILTIKPEKPKSIMVTTVNNKKVDSVILKYSKNGYILKSVTNTGGTYSINIVMEKY